MHKLEELTVLTDKAWKEVKKAQSIVASYINMEDGPITDEAGYLVADTIHMTAIEYFDIVNEGNTQREVTKISEGNASNFIKLFH